MPVQNPKATEYPGNSSDAEELQEWCEAFHSLLRHGGCNRAIETLDALVACARDMDLPWQAPCNTPYVNTIKPQAEAPYPGDLTLECKLTAIMRWNAMAMVAKANERHADLGGHIATYASAADLFETGFNHCFRADSPEARGDLVYFQPHAAPGVYARAFLEGRLSAVDLGYYRQEVSAREQGEQGLSSYPHPWLMEAFWQFPTGSMGIGPIHSIYQARFMRYLQHRNLLQTDQRTVWGLFGDGEMDEPESLSALTLAAREKLDNLIWVINCNLQRLDGPVRGNGRIIDELEALFHGAGWHVIKLLWGSDWDPLFAADKTGALTKAFSLTVDGQLQTFAAKDAHYNRQHFFGQNAALRSLASQLSDAQIDQLRRGGHDPVKIHTAYLTAMAHQGQPVVILAQTKKGFGMGASGQGRMTTHQVKKLDRAALREFRDRFELPLSDSEADNLSFYLPPADSPELRYLHKRRAALGGYLPKRSQHALPVAVPDLPDYAQFALEAAGKTLSTTKAMVRMLGRLLANPTLGPRLVPIVADEARTFGMAALFRQYGIYSSQGQRYQPEDTGSILCYREAMDGQILEEGISEAGAISSWTAAATAYSTHGLRMLPFYIFYSMFGFQRVGDLIWAAADQRARGFLIGATAGRTTLGGEGLQHQDGHSHLIASTIPNCRAYDPAFAAELAVILDYGMREMLEQDTGLFYYITVMNESYCQPELPEGVEPDIIKGMYQLTVTPVETPIARVRLLGAGSIVTEVMAAAQMLAKDWHISSEVWSVTSFTQLEREAREVERWNRLNPLAEPRQCHVQQCLPGHLPVVAASDYVRALPQLVAPYVDARYSVLGTDGFGRSDTRRALRSFFAVDRYHITHTALYALHKEGLVTEETCAEAIKKYQIDGAAVASWDI